LVRFGVCLASKLLGNCNYSRVVLFLLTAQVRSSPIRYPSPPHPPNVALSFCRSTWRRVSGIREPPRNPEFSICTKDPSSLGQECLFAFTTKRNIPCCHSHEEVTNFSQWLAWRWLMLMNIRALSPFPPFLFAFSGR